MPIYEYLCNDCSHAFETLVRNGAKPDCPACKSGSLQRTLSVFAVSKKTYADGDLSDIRPCGTCGDTRGPGACSLN